MRPPERASGAPRVLIAINDLLQGGAQQVAVSHARWLAELGYDVRLASLERAPRGGMIDVCRDAAIDVTLLRAPRESQFAAYPRLLTLLREWRPAVVHTHLAIAGVAARVAARVARVPRLCTTLHNLTDWQERAGDPVRTLDRATLRGCDAILAVSDAIRVAAARRAPSLAARIRVVHNGVDVAAFARDDAARSASRAAHGFADTACVVGTVARLDPRKGVDLLLEAFADAAASRTDLMLLVVGDGRDGERLRARAHERGVADRVRFAGACADVRPQLAAMDVFALPSRTEGLGIALIEALAAGLPALASDVGGIPEVAGGSPAVRLLPAGDAAAWTDALGRIARDPATRARMAAAATARAAAFSTSVCRAALADVYAGLAAVPAVTEATTFERAA